MMSFVPDPRYQCPVCDKTFARAYTLNRHMMFHPRPSQNRPLPDQHGGGYGDGGAGASSQPGPSSAPQPGPFDPPSPGGSSSSDPTSPASPGASSSGDNNGGVSSVSVSRSNRVNVALPDDLAPEGFEEFETAFQSRLKSYRLREECRHTNLTIPEYLDTMFDRVVSLLTNALKHVHALKTNLWLDCEFENVHGQTCRRAFKTQNVAIFRLTNLEEVCRSLFHKLVAEKEACDMKGSGWTFLRIWDMEIRLNVYRPLGGSSYIDLPPTIKNKKAVRNVVNDDQRCFEYALLSRYVQDPNRRQLHVRDFTPELRARANLDFSDLRFPVSIDQIPSFERKNGVSINVYGLDTVRTKKGTGGDYQTIVFPLRVAVEEEGDPSDHFDLLYITDDERTHYAFISDFERLVRSQITRHHGRVYICKRCFAHFDERAVAMGLGGAQRLNEHKRYCKEHAALRVDVSEKRKIRFDKPERTQRSRFTIYADFECALEPVNQDLPPSTIPPPDWDLASSRPGLPHHHHRKAGGAGIESASVTTRSIHKPYSYAYYVYDSQCGANASDDDATQYGDDGGETFTRFRTYRGPNAAEHFMRSIRDDVMHIGEILYAYRRLAPQLSAAEEAAFQAETHCYLCGGEFPESGNVKVRDHQHSPPYQYRGAAHRDCNLRHKEQTKVNCYFHNLSNYDAHFVVRELGVDEGNVTVLANNEEKYITFTKHFAFPGAGRHNSLALRFVDSYRFLSKGLASLASILPPEKMVNLQAFFPEQEKFALVRRKGVFPYEHVTSLAVLDETSLPPIAAFHDSLSMEDVTVGDYTHAQHVWAEFQCETLGDYADVYLKTDVLLLADIFQSFRDMCLQHYGLDPAHWVTLPSFAWDVMLRKTGVTLDTLQDVDMYLFFEKGIRGGLTQCVARHVVANNKYTRGSVDDGHDDDTHTMYYDSNNLYGWAMSQFLPYGGFRFLGAEERDSLDVLSIKEDGDIGYVLEVDLEYPREPQLHDRHRDLPFCPEMRKAPVDQLPYSAEVLRECSVGKSEKLMATLMDKEGYVIHYRLLQQALQNGLRIRRIHRVLEFHQKPWLKPYVQLNTTLRQQASNKFEQELFKLMVNAVYGMSLQNVRKHANVCLATNPASYTRYVARSNFVDRTWYREDLALIRLSKVRVVLDRPVYAGMCILDHSKWWMYGFHYKMVDRYGLDRIRLAYTDTDSLIYSIQTKDVYQDMLDHLDDFDTSNYPAEHKCHSVQNAKVLGKFKDESDGRVIHEFIGLMAKLYCITFCGEGDDNEGPPPIKKAKGVNRAVVAHRLSVDDYRRCLQEQTVKSTANDRFMSRHHNMFTVTVSKKSLTPFDDKRYVVPENGVDTLPWGHYKIPPPPAPQNNNDQDEAMELDQELVEALESLANN